MAIEDAIYRSWIWAEEIVRIKKYIDIEIEIKIISD